MDGLGIIAIVMVNSVRQKAYCISLLLLACLRVNLWLMYMMTQQIIQVITTIDTIQKEEDIGKTCRLERLIIDQKIKSCRSNMMSTFTTKAEYPTVSDFNWNSYHSNLPICCLFICIIFWAHASRFEDSDLENGATHLINENQTAKGNIPVLTSTKGNNIKGKSRELQVSIAENLGTETDMNKMPEKDNELGDERKKKLKNERNKKLRDENNTCEQDEKLRAQRNEHETETYVEDSFLEDASIREYLKSNGMCEILSCQYPKHSKILSNGKVSNDCIDDLERSSCRFEDKKGCSEKISADRVDNEKEPASNNVSEKKDFVFQFNGMGVFKMHSSFRSKCCSIRDKSLKLKTENYGEVYSKPRKRMRHHVEEIIDNEYKNNVKRRRVSDAHCRDICYRPAHSRMSKNVSLEKGEEKKKKKMFEDIIMDAEYSIIELDTSFKQNEINIRYVHPTYYGVENGCTRCRYGDFIEVSLIEEVPDLSFDSDDDELFESESSLILHLDDKHKREYIDEDTDFSMQKMLVTHRQNLRKVIEKSYDTIEEIGVSSVSVKENRKSTKDDQRKMERLNNERNSDYFSSFNREMQGSLQSEYNCNTESTYFNIEMPPYFREGYCNKFENCYPEIAVVCFQSANAKIDIEKRREESESGFYSLRHPLYTKDEIKDETLQNKKKVRNMIWNNTEFPNDLLVCPVRRKENKTSLHELNALDLETDDRGEQVNELLADNQDHLDGPGLKSYDTKQHCTSTSNTGSYTSLTSNQMASGTVGNNCNAQSTSRLNIEASASNQLLLKDEHSLPLSDNSLESYFKERVAGKYFTMNECMCYEWLRLKTFENYPVSVPVNALLLARIGFYSSGNDDRVECFSCGMNYAGFRMGDKPTDIHQRRSPNCRMIKGIESANVPIITQDKDRSVVRQDSAASMLRNVTSLQNGHEASISMEQHSTNHGMTETTKQQSLVTTDQAHSSTLYPSHLRTHQRQIESSPPWSRPPARQKEQSPPRSRPPVRQMEQSPPQSRPPIGGGDRAEDLGIMIERPKYPAYAQLKVRVSTFSGWPGYLYQSPRDMALAGLFYAGYNDYCRCFFCGGGLRHWDAGDDPWIEHARWFPKCAFVKQNKGQRFVECVLKKHAEMQSNSIYVTPVNDARVLAHSNNIQTGVQSHISYATSSRSPETHQFKATTVNNSGSYVQFHPATQIPQKMTVIDTIRDIGYSEGIIQRAIDILKRQNPGKDQFETTSILEVIFAIEDEHGHSNAAPTPEDYQINPQQTRQKQNATTPSTKSQSKYPMSSAQIVHNTHNQQALSVNTLGDKGACGGSLEGKEALLPCTQEQISELEIRSLQEENIQLKEQVMCKICMDKNVSIAFLPCGHLACCIDCAPAMRKCPMCRVFIKGTVKTYLA